MTRLEDVMKLELLQEHIANKLVRKATHPQYPELSLYTYTEQAQFSRTWDEVTNQCRGLITETIDGVEYIKARGFNKFHNINTSYIPETMEENLPSEDPIGTTKLDGSLGIIYTHGSQNWVATKGSFDSEQSRFATQFLRGRYPSFVVPLESTPQVEIIYPENQIVVNYGNKKELIYLGSVYNRDGHDLSREYAETFSILTGIPIVSRFNKKISEYLKEDNPNEEGYVLTYSNGLKIKVKFADYCRLHKIVTGINPRGIWELLSTNNKEAVDSLQINMSLPDDFRKWIKNISAELIKKYNVHLGNIELYWTKLLAGPIDISDYQNKATRKKIAEEVMKHPPYTKMLFLRLEGKPYAPLVWKLVYPSAEDTFRKDGE